MAMLDFLDAPRQATWNLGRGLSDMLQGNAPSWGDVMPGVGGLTMGAASLASGGTLPLAMLLGSAIGGFGQQMVGNQAASPGDVVKSLGGDPESTGGQAGSLALSILGDPLLMAGLPGTSGLRGAKAAMPGLAESRLGGMAGQDFGRMAENRLGGEASKFDQQVTSRQIADQSRNELSRPPIQWGELPTERPGKTMTWGSPAEVGEATDAAMMRAAPDILRGVVPQGEDIGSLSQMIARGGGDASRLGPVMEQGGARDILDQVAQAPPSFHFNPKSNFRGAELPQVRGGYEMPIGESRAPIDPQTLMDQASRRPDLTQMLTEMSTGDVGALTARPPRTMGVHGDVDKLRWEGRSKRIQEALADLLSRQQGGM